MSRFVTASTWFAGAALLLSSLSGSLAQAAEPAGHSAGPVYIFGVYKDCALDVDATNAVSGRLQQMGESVQPTSADKQSATCAGARCVQHLRARDSVLKQGRLLGGRLRVQPSGETSTRLWLTDVQTEETVYSDESCSSCDALELLARQAADLLEKPLSAAADSRGLSRTSGAANAGAADSTPAASAGELKRIALSVRGGNTSTALALTAAANKALLQMGYEVASSARGSAAPNAARGADLPTLDVSLIKDKATGHTSIVLRHLNSSGGQTSVNVDCGSDGCRGNQLDRIARMNIGTLLDAAAPAQTYPLASVVAADRAQAQLQDPTECQPKIAAGPAAPFAPGSNPPDEAGQPNPQPVAPSVPQTVKAQTDDSRHSWKPYLKTWRIVGGLVAAGAAGAGLGMSLFLNGRNGLSRPGSCMIGDLHNIPCIDDTSTNRSLAAGLSAVGFSSLIVVLAFPTTW